MSTTIPCILRALGTKYPLGFEKSDLLEAMILSGYNSDTAERRWKMMFASNQIITTKSEKAQGAFITLYAPAHWQMFKDELDGVRIRACKVERDGSVTYL